jgi:hypothetical protein
MPSGKWFDKQGNNLARPKLVIDAREHPDMINAAFNGFFEGDNQYGESNDKLKSLFSEDEKNSLFKEEMCAVMSQYKYLIIIDGHTATWPRVPQVMLSDSVPIVVESGFYPLYIDKWEPFVHYVPVKNDQSDLYEQIKWLQEHDKEAKEIALASQLFYKELYTLENMTKDAVSVFSKYKDLMTYEPTRPDAKYRFNE